jgi:acetoin utilization protein AcuC
MKTSIIYSKELKNYDFGPGHPFRSDRFESFLKLYEQTLACDPNFQLIENNQLATDQQLQLWHSREYIQAIKAASAGIELPELFRFVSHDNINPLTMSFPAGIEQAARAIVKNSMLAVDYVQQGKSKKAVSLGGGLHHAMAGYGEGFCVYNDVVIAVRYAIQEYNLKRVLVLDTDAHAGNGTCAAFYSDPQVLFIDLHQRGIYPGTGSTEEIGEGAGRGFTVNMALEDGTGDRAYELIFDELIGPLALEFKPEMIVRYGGCDPHFSDSITGLGLTLQGLRMIAGKVNLLSSELCEGRSVDLICSGYNPSVLAKAWLTLVATLGGSELRFEERPPRLRSPDDAQIQTLIASVKKNLRPYWKCMHHV